MTRTNKLQLSPPYEVETCLKKLGRNLRMARKGRNLTIEDAAQRIGTGPRAVMDAEKGKSSTSIVVYAALFWLYDQLEEFKKAADSLNDLQTSGGRRRKTLDNDF